jgi:hypothetical protein
MMQRTTRKLQTAMLIVQDRNFGFQRVDSSSYWTLISKRNICQTHLSRLLAELIFLYPIGSPCISCLTLFPEESIVHCPCDHKYCAQCLTDHFKAGIQGTAFHPSCCYEEIPLNLAQPHPSLIPASSQPHPSLKLQANYAAKRLAIDKTGTIYCALLSCQILVAPQNISKGRATCALCKTVTCVVCKFTAHDDTCPEDNERATLLRLAVTKGLRACYHCGELCVKGFGCNHMTYVPQYQIDLEAFADIWHSCTKCSAQFCYNCGLNGGLAVMVLLNIKLRRLYVREKWLRTELFLLLPL